MKWYYFDKSQRDRNLYFQVLQKSSLHLLIQLNAKRFVIYTLKHTIHYSVINDCNTILVT